MRLFPYELAISVASFCGHVSVSFGERSLQARGPLLSRSLVFVVESRESPVHPATSVFNATCGSAGCCDLMLSPGGRAGVSSLTPEGRGRLSELTSLARHRVSARVKEESAHGRVGNSIWSIFLI